MTCSLLVRTLAASAVLLSSTVHAQEARGIFFDIGVAQLDGALGSRASGAVGYRFSSGFGLLAGAQRLHALCVSDVYLFDPGTPVSSTQCPDARSKALLAFYEKSFGDDASWLARGYLGAHRWTVDARFRYELGFAPVVERRFTDSGIDPAAMVEISKRVSRRVSIGGRIERYWTDQLRTDRFHAFVRVALGEGL